MNNTMKTPVAIPVSKLHPFEGHPYKVLDNEEMNTLIESIQTQGILSPLIVRPMENTTDEYEVVSGHRRLHAAMMAGLETVPAFIYALDRDAAAIAVVDSNLHREHILPSEKAFAYKMKFDAMSHQGKTSDQLGPKLTVEQISENDSATQVKRYIRLTYLIPELLTMMDEGKIALSVGVELSFLSEQFQYDVLEICEMNDCTPSYSQAWHLHQYYKDGALDKYLIFKTLSEEKANQRETIKVPMDRLRDIVPESYTVKQTEDFLIKAAEYYHRNIIRQRNRDSR
ncbi:ParB/RepB/Spo0J family partition protein [Candidatus Pseudoruminococcus sp.]|uniref:ParB/RepB/Spo0J family partition protein n=1 Tax=Candidatus Pseudoruminococcus sp. TaxID=3101048 RepID=UPI00399C48A7